MKILNYISGLDGCGYYRCVIPSLAINKLGYQSCIRTYFSKEAIDWADIIIFQKQYKEDAFYWLNYAKSQNKITLYEADDDYFNIPEWNPTHKWFKENISQWQKFMSQTDGIIVSTEYLKSQFQKYNKNIYVCQNAIDFDIIDQIKKKTIVQNINVIDSKFKRKILSNKEIEKSKEDYIHLGWGGSPTHEKDLKIVEDVLLTLLNKYPNLKIFNIGYTLRWLAEKAPKDRFFMIEGVDVNLYLPLLHFCQLDIGIAPLEDNLFNRSKSNLKIIEYMSLNVAAVASNVENYTKTLINHKDAGILVNNSANDWLKNLEKLIKNKQLINQYKENGYMLAKQKYNSLTEAQNRISLFKNLGKIYG